MFTKHVKPVLNWFKQAVTEPRNELDRWEAAVRFAYDLGIHGWKALNRDNAPQMAAALAFRTLFALLPVVVVSTVVVRAIGGEQRFNELVQGILSAMGAYDVPFNTDEQGNPISLAQWLEGLVAAAAGLNLTALGWIGFAVVVYSAIGLLVTIENSFNAIYGAPEGRYWNRRIPMYWLLLTMGPVFIGVTLYMDKQFAGFISAVETWKWLLTTIKIIWGFAVAWLFMLAVYRLVPNTKVQLKAALAGAFVAAIFLTVGKASLGAYFQNAVSIQSLYGSLGAIPLFMFWVYLMWLVVLFGLEVSATIQMLAGRQLEEIQELQEKRPQNGLVDPASVLNVMEIISERFAAGQSTTTREIADETLIPEAMVAQMIDRLVRAGFLHRIDVPEGAEVAVTLTKPPDSISGDRLIEIGFELVDEAGVGRQSALLQRLREVQRDIAGRTSLASLISAGGTAGRRDQVSPAT